MCETSGRSKFLLDLYDTVSCYFLLVPGLTSSSLLGQSPRPPLAPFPRKILLKEKLTRLFFLKQQQHDFSVATVVFFGEGA